MKIQEFAKHLDEPREIGKKKKRLSSSEMKKIKDKAFETYKEIIPALIKQRDEPEYHLEISLPVQQIS